MRVDSSKGEPLAPCAHPRAASADRFFSSKLSTPINNEGEEDFAMITFGSTETRYFHVGEPSNVWIDSAKGWEIIDGSAWQRVERSRGKGPFDERPPTPRARVVDLQHSVAVALRDAIILSEAVNGSWGNVPIAPCYRAIRKFGFPIVWAGTFAHCYFLKGMLFPHRTIGMKLKL